MRYLKTYKIFEASHEEIMSMIYGANVIKECDSLIDDIKDILLEYDFNSNIYISKDKSISLLLNYCRQSGLGYDKAESFNFGINKDF
jgi:hypothetical protein